MNTSYATAGDPAGRGMPSTRQSADIGGAGGEAGPAALPFSTRKPRQPGATEGRRTLDPVHAGGVRNHRGRRMALR